MPWVSCLSCAALFFPPLLDLKKKREGQGNECRRPLLLERKGESSGQGGDYVSSPSCLPSSSLSDEILGREKRRAGQCGRETLLLEKKERERAASRVGWAGENKCDHREAGWFTSFCLALPPFPNLVSLSGEKRERQARQGEKGQSLRSSLLLALPSSSP